MTSAAALDVSTYILVGDDIDVQHTVYEDQGAIEILLGGRHGFGMQYTPTALRRLRDTCDDALSVLPAPDEDPSRRPPMRTQRRVDPAGPPTQLARAG